MPQQPSIWRRSGLLPVLLLLGGGLAAWATGALDGLAPDRIAGTLAAWQALVAAHPWLAQGLYAAVLTGVVASAMPGSMAVTLAGGALLGVAEGTLVGIVAETAGSVLLFLAGGLAWQALGLPQPALVARVQEGYARRPFAGALLLRFVPFVPGGAITLALAWLGCRGWVFTATTAVGSAVSLVLETALGRGVAEMAGSAPSLAWLAHPAIALPLGGILLPGTVMAVVWLVRWRARATARAGERRATA